MTMRAYSTSMQDSLKAYTFGNACGRQIQSHGLSKTQARMETNFVASEVFQRISAFLQTIDQINEMSSCQRIPYDPG